MFQTSCVLENGSVCLLNILIFSHFGSFRGEADEPRIEREQGHEKVCANFASFPENFGNHLKSN